MKRLLLAALLAAALSGPASASTVCDRGGRCADVAGGHLLIRPYRPVYFSCSLAGQAAALAQCQALLAGRVYYVTGVVAQSTTTTAGDFAVQSGTGTNCGTGTTPIFPGAPATTAARFKAPPNTSAPLNVHFVSPLLVTAGHAICAIGMATNTLNITITGFYDL